MSTLIKDTVFGCLWQLECTKAVSPPSNCFLTKAMPLLHTKCPKPNLHRSDHQTTMTSFVETWNHVIRFTALNKYDSITHQGLGRSVISSSLFHTPHKLLGTIRLPLLSHSAALSFFICHIGCSLLLCGIIF